MFLFLILNKIKDKYNRFLPRDTLDIWNCNKTTIAVPLSHTITDNKFKFNGALKAADQDYSYLKCIFANYFVLSVANNKIVKAPVKNTPVYSNT